MSIAISEAGFLCDRYGVPAWVRSRHCARTAASLVWTVVFLALAEAGLRVRAWHRHGSLGPVADVYEQDPQLGRRPRPGARVVGSARQVSINRWGFPGAEVSRDKPAGTIRIAAIGDSTTFGMEAESDESVWVAQLASRLRDGRFCRRL